MLKRIEMILDLRSGRLTRVTAGKFAESTFKDGIALAIGGVGARVDYVMLLMMHTAVGEALLLMMRRRG